MESARAESVSAEVARADATEQERRWHRIRQGAAVAYVLALCAVVAIAGVPTDRGSLLLIILAGIGIPCLGRGWRSFGKALLDWLPFTAVLVVYDVSRGIADGLGLPLHMSDVAAVDRDMFGTVPTVWLQQRFLDPGSPHWYDAVATLVYTSHFLATPVVAAVLWLRNRDAGNLLSEGQLAANPVAAMPSLHTAFATLIALFVAARLRGWHRYLTALYPLAMGLALVYLGEHYVIDLIAGVGYALAVHYGVRAWESRRRAPA